MQRGIGRNHPLDFHDLPVLPSYLTTPKKETQSNEQPSATASPLQQGKVFTPSKAVESGGFSALPSRQNLR